MVYARMRNHDLMFAEKVALDMSETGDLGFLDVMSRYFKMNVVLGMDGEYINYVAPAVGVSSRCWARRWCDLLQSEGLLNNGTSPM
eukprot:3264858-Amphidinium_carterae.1